jgi:hypothetical protein
LARVALAASLLALVGQLAHALADERIEGVVRHTTVAHCDATKAGGCAGTLIMERQTDGKAGPLTVRVPLGTPISCGNDNVHLHRLHGKTVVVTLISDSNGTVARAVQVAEPEPC